MKAKQRTLAVLLFLILLAGGAVCPADAAECPGRTGCQCSRGWSHPAGGSFGAMT